MQLKKQKCHTFWIHYKSTEILQAFYYFNIADYGLQLKKTQKSYLKKFEYFLRPSKKKRFITAKQNQTFENVH